jgi:chromosome partitioning protein
LCATSIPRNIRLAEAPSHGKPALLYDVRSRGAESYIRLAKEIIAHYFPTAAGDAEGAPAGAPEAPAAAEEEVVAETQETAPASEVAAQETGTQEPEQGAENAGDEMGKTA